MTTSLVIQRRFFQRKKWGLMFAGVYLLVCMPCAVVYTVVGHEYSIPLLIVYFASVPTHFLLFEILRPVTRAIENLPYGMALGLWIWVGLTALLYFAVGQVVGRIICAIARRKIHMRNNCLLAVMLLSFVTYAKEDENRIYMDVFINDQPAKLIFDTGAEGPVLFREAARRLNLQVSEHSGDIKVKPGEVKIAMAKNCRFRFEDGGTESLVTFGVVDMPEQIHYGCDGLFGWSGIKNMMFEMNFAAPHLKVRNTINFDKSKWKCLDIKKDVNVLVVKLPSEDSTQDYLLIDTGDQGGLTVRKELWKQLSGDLPDQNTTLFSGYYPGVGLVVDREKWIHQVNYGGLIFHEIPVQMGMEVHQNLTDMGIDGIIGIWGLTCYNWIVDGPAGKIYFQPNELVRIPEKCTYNRLGAVFVPKDIQTGKALLAHVIKVSPAYTAGIRDGDELLRIGQLDVTKWRTDPNVLPLSRFWEQSAGTELDLVLMRDGEKKKIKVKLAEIFKQ